MPQSSKHGHGQKKAAESANGSSKNQNQNQNQRHNKTQAEQHHEDQKAANEISMIQAGQIPFDPTTHAPNPEPPTYQDHDRDQPQQQQQRQEEGSGQVEKRKKEDSSVRPGAKKDSIDIEDIVTEAPRAPVTIERTPAHPQIPYASIPRATYAPSSDGTYNISYRTFLKRSTGGKETGEGLKEHDVDQETGYPDYENNKGYSVLQKHCAFFDRDNDGVIWPQDTYVGFRALGFNLIISVLAVFIINSAFSYPTVSGFLPDPFFRIYIKNIHKDKHGSDSGTYDTEGRFRLQQFEDAFSKYGDGKGLTLTQILGLVKGNRLVVDPFGWFAGYFEWLTVYWLIWPADGKVTKEEVRGIFDGSFFHLVRDRELERSGKVKGGKPIEPYWRRENKFGSTIPLN